MNIVAPDRPPVKEPVSPKVQSATLGAGAAVVTTDFVLWGIDHWAFPGEGNIPTPVSAFTLFIVTIIVTFLSGYLKKD